MSGGGGGRAIAYLIESGTKKGDILMVNSTPIVLRALSGRIPYSYRDLTPVASMVADYGAFVVRNDSPFKTWEDVIKSIKEDPSSIKVAGGSARGSMDHLVAVTSGKPLPDYPEIPTLKSLGYDMEFVNWRGLFAAPNLPAEKLAQYTKKLRELQSTPEWEAVRARNGWLNLFQEKDEFIKSLEAQEAQLKVVMEELGFIRAAR